MQFLDDQDHANNRQNNVDNFHGAYLIVKHTDHVYNHTNIVDDNRHNNCIDDNASIAVHNIHIFDDSTDHSHEVYLDAL